MKRYIKRECFRTFAVRICLLILVLLAPIRSFAAGWIPTNAGLVVDLQPGDSIMLSVWIDLNGNSTEDAGEEFFVCHRTSKLTGDRFNYAAGDYLKLIPVTPTTDNPKGLPDGAIWRIDTALTRNNIKVDKITQDYPLGGVAYTMWSKKGYTLTTANDKYKFEGKLTDNDKGLDLCDVVFCVPTVRAMEPDMDPKHTLDLTDYTRGTGGIAPTWAFDGKTGEGFDHKIYREVYWFEIPRRNGPINYTNAALVTFNTTTKDTTYAKPDAGSGNTIKKGYATYAYADKKHQATIRTLFRLYNLSNPFVSYPSSYFFAYDEQSRMCYRDNQKGTPEKMTDSTTVRKVYTIDHMFRMDQVGATTKYQTGVMRIPSSDSAFFYVGYNDKFYSSNAGTHLPGTDNFSDFWSIYRLHVKELAAQAVDVNDTNFSAKSGACGRMVFNLDPACTTNNISVLFEPAGYFLRTSSGKNARMIKTGDHEWTSESIWYIDDAWTPLSIKATLYTGEKFSESDPGADIRGWSGWELCTDIPFGEGHVTAGSRGLARIYTDQNGTNGNLVLLPADETRYIIYDNNGLLGTQIPNQYPAAGEPEETVMLVQEPRLKYGFNFTGWNTAADGNGWKTYQPGDTIKLSANHPRTLYAQGSYTGTYNVAVSFMQDGKRYFMTHPGAGSPRYSRARHYDDWTNVYQGMKDANNEDPNYLNTWKTIGHEHTCVECADGQYVFDPRQETIKGAEDTLRFYENFKPGKEEYLGLYYENPNVVIANNTWAGLFESKLGWPTYNQEYINNTKLFSTEYLKRDGEGQIQKLTRSNSDKPYIQYNTTLNQFDGVAGEANGTDFQISNVVVADAHYVVLPDTSVAWSDEIVFDYHNEQTSQKQVYSRLIGKQLMAAMFVSGDTIYFHPNRKKIYTSASELRLSTDFRLTQSITFIPDARAQSVIAADDKVTTELFENGFRCQVTSGNSSPIINVKFGDRYDDVCDTLRIRLNQGGISRIKKYYGRWSDNAPGLHKVGKSARYRDVIIRTKAYHYGATATRLVLKPEFAAYNFGPLSGQSQTINFTLTKETYCQLLDADGNYMYEEILASKDTTTSGLALGPGACTFASTSGESSTYFSRGEAVNQHIIISTKSDNAEAVNTDTLIVSLTIDGQALSVRIPLQQAALADDELIWSAVYDGKRYFIMAGTGGLIFRQFTRSKDNKLYKFNTSNTPLVKGAADAANSQAQYITPWKYEYVAAKGVSERTDHLTLLTQDPVNKYFNISGEEGSETIGVGDDATSLTFEFDHVNINDNANYEELVYLRYGADKWLKFNGPDAAQPLSLTKTKGEATLFSWGYLLREYTLLNNGVYPSQASVTFNHDVTDPVTITTKYKAYREYSMLIDNTMTYLCRENESTLANLIDADKDWKTTYEVSLIADARTFDTPATSGLAKTPDGSSTFESTITPSGASPTNVTIGGKHVNIVDTLRVTIGTQNGAPKYRFAEGWSSFKSVEDAQVKIPLIRKTYHTVPYDSLVCVVDGDEYNHTFSSKITTGEGGNDTHTFNLHTQHTEGTSLVDVDNEVISYTINEVHYHSDMNLGDPSRAEVRLADIYGNTPDWCEITAVGDSSVTVKCLKNGIRSPREAFVYLAYIVTTDGGEMRFVNYRLSVSQLSFYQEAGVNNQTLEHTRGASGDDFMDDGRQQAHENKRILYYYNPQPYDEPDQSVELPVRERGFYGWWRWYEEKYDPDLDSYFDIDIPKEKWIKAPQNTGNANYPFRVIGDTIWNDPEDHSQGVKEVRTMGRYTVFEYPSSMYKNKNDPPSKTPLVAPPADKAVVTYVVDISNYTDNLPKKISDENQIDTARLDTMKHILEPTLSVRESFELHPWTEMAARLDTFKYTAETPIANQKYMEDHVVMAPAGHRLLLNTEQRYDYDHLKAKGHSESLLGYYMRDDNWARWSGDTDRQDTMIWCGGWEADHVDCVWYTYTPKNKTYQTCRLKTSTEEDFLIVTPDATRGKEGDTIYYCLRAQSKKSTYTKVGDDSIANSVPGDYWFNICRYMVILHSTNKYGPKQEIGGEALKTNKEIEFNYETLERLNFDYNKPGSEYTIYPHPLQWSDASYGYTYPISYEIPHNRFHPQAEFPGPGEYAIINFIKDYSKEYGEGDTYWRPVEQHGGKENGYMIYCDGMSSSGQVAALSLSTNLCTGQKMYFSGYVGNISNREGKANPNFTISVQGSNDNVVWEDITSYMTGDIEPSDNWYQIFFPISQEKDYEHFRVRIYNMAQTYDGNDFIIDDLCIFATKPQLVAYQANTTCREAGEKDSVTHVVLRVDYQAFIGDDLNDADVCYTIQKVKGTDTTSVVLEDEYFNQQTLPGKDASTPDTLYGLIKMPGQKYKPEKEDSVFSNVTDLISRFERTLHKDSTLFRQGYVFENLDDSIRPVMYVIHSAKITAEKDTRYLARMAGGTYKDLKRSVCALTSNLKVTNRVILQLNGEEYPEMEPTGLCANTAYDISLSVKGSLFADSVAPIELNGSCVNDWLVYGDTVEDKASNRYGHYYSDIVKVVTKILRCEPERGENANQFAPNFTSVSREEMERIQKDQNVTLKESIEPYDLLKDLVDNGFLVLYTSHLVNTVAKGDSIQYVIMPIVGTGSDAMHQANVEVCPTPVVIKIKPTKGDNAPLIIGHDNISRRDPTQPLVVLMDEQTANEEIVVHIQSLSDQRIVNDAVLISTNDTNFLEGVHTLTLLPDRVYNTASGASNPDYYTNGSDVLFHPASSNTYHMRPGFDYTFAIELLTRTGGTQDAEGCDAGRTIFTLSVVPSYLRWDPKNPEDNKWNNPDNWLGVDQFNEPIRMDAHYAPLATSAVIIPTLSADQPYPALLEEKDKPATETQEGIVYNSCDYIRFMPGAAIADQQRLTYGKVIADMDIPYRKWALRAAPVTGLISGDIFMADADLSGSTKPWEVGEFDANARNYTYGNATFWLSLFSQTTHYKGNGDQVSDSIREVTDAKWSAVTNAMKQSLPPAQGWAVFARTQSGDAADIRLPKDDDIYYYYYKSGGKNEDMYEQNLQAERTKLAGADGAGKLAYPHADGSMAYTMTNSVATTTFAFGNPTMGYIDIWGFIEDNTSLLEDEIGYIDGNGIWQAKVPKATAIATENKLNNLQRYLPPMHAIMLTKKGDAAASLAVTVDTSRVVTKPVVAPVSPAPKRATASLKKGIMTVTAINPKSYRYTSRLLLGQGYNKAVIRGEDAVLTSVNINNYTQNTTPAMPFNIYAVEDGYGLSVNLLDTLYTVPLSFFMTTMTEEKYQYDSVTYLWFTGVNNIGGKLVLYDALTDTERTIIDGICLDIETPAESHQVRYYIRRVGPVPTIPDDPDPDDPIITTDYSYFEPEVEQAVKIIYNGHVLIKRNGHIYTMFGQKVK